MPRLAGSLIGGKENRCGSRHTQCHFALAYACDRCGKRLGEQDLLLPTSCGQFHRVTFSTLSHVLLGRDLLKLFPELRLHISSLSRYVRSFLPPDVFNDFM